MEATMTDGARSEAIGFGGAFARQFRYLWMSRRPILLAVALLAALVLAGDPWIRDSQLMRLLTFWPVWVVLAPMAWAFAVFHNEGPDSRLYFWSHPAGRGTQTLARLVAGLAWLWLTYVGLILVGWLVGVMDGDAWQLAEISALGWANWFTGATISFLLISILTVPSNYPFRWFFAIIFAFPLAISMLVEWLEVDERILEAVLWPLGDEKWGLGPTMVSALANDLEQLGHALRAMQDPTYTGTSHFDIETWWAATPVWIILLSAVVVFLATRHPDRLPKWRGFRR